MFSTYLYGIALKIRYCSVPSGAEGILSLLYFRAMQTLIRLIANSQTWFIHLMRIAILIVMAWIGGLKAFQYEADGIVPFVANSPFMSFFYHKEAPEYQAYKNPEGKMVAKNIEWHQENGT